MKKLVPFIALAMCLLAASCQHVKFVTVCYEQKSDFNQATKKHADLKAVTVDEMGALLKKDNGIKVVVEYEPCQQSSYSLIKRVDNYRKANKEKLHTYYVADNCGRLQDVNPMFASLGVDAVKYYYRDDSAPYLSYGKESPLYKDRISSMLKAHFVNGKDITPYNNRSIRCYIVNGEGKVKLARYTYTNEKGMTFSVVGPLSFDHATFPLNDMDFNVIDEIVINKNTKDPIYNGYFRIFE